jgi:hypothetical protein
MKKQLIIVCFFLAGYFLPVQANIYIVYYATVQGRTGHMGIAVDNYKFIYREVNTGGRITEIVDTLPTGDLTYYDLWPADDQVSLSRTTRDISPLYFILPLSSTDEITVNSLIDFGLPHREFYPCDGLLSIPGDWHQDQSMRNILDSMIGLNRAFNATRFNCADFVKQALEKFWQLELQCSEFVLTGWSTTPNKLYAKLKQHSGVQVIRDAGKKAEGSFIRERIIQAVLVPTPPNSINHEN